MNSEKIDNIKDSRKKHRLPVWIVIVVIFIVAFVIGLVVTPSAAASVVKLLGFGPAGPIHGSWAAREQSRIGNITAGSSFAIAQSIGMGGPVPWYGWIYGGLILGTLVLVTCGLIMLVYRCVFRRSRHRFHPLPEDNDDNNSDNNLKRSESRFSY